LYLFSLRYISQKKLFVCLRCPFCGDYRESQSVHVDKISDIVKKLYCQQCLDRSLSILRSNSPNEPVQIYQHLVARTYSRHEDMWDTEKNMAGWV